MSLLHIVALLSAAETTLAVAASPLPAVVKCGEELYPVGTGFPLPHLSDPEHPTVNDVIAVDKVVLVSASGAPTGTVLAYRISVANGSVYYQTVHEATPELWNKEKAFFRAGQVHDPEFVFGSYVPIAAPLKVGIKVLQETGTAIVPCTKAP